MSTRSGIGFDVHPFVEGRPLVVGGVTMEFELGLDGQSDGDVLCHAVIDALLGAAGLGDIGDHFPSSNPDYTGAVSTRLLSTTVDIIGASGWKADYVDATILAEKPIMAPYKNRIKAALSPCLRIDESLINVKATTTDGLGFIGRGEGIGSMVVATVSRIE